MGILALRADERVANVSLSADSLCVALMDGRFISVPLAWYPKLLHATEEQRKNWKIAGGGYGIHWPHLDEDLSTEGLLRGAPAPAHRSSASSTGRARRMFRRIYQEMPGEHEAVSTGFGLVVVSGPLLLTGYSCGLVGSRGRCIRATH
jgi:Protein of unknown function (DUF2442)